MDKNQTSFNYSAIPLGYYDGIALRKRGVRSFWHNLKFKRIIDSFEYDQKTILDIGCFAGTFLGMLPIIDFNKQIGVDILKEQVNYANEKYGNEFRKFYLLEDFNNNELFKEVKFDVITLIEVIEHLSKPQLADMITYAHSKLKPNGSLIITTPNYSSAWPVLELILNKVSDVKYEEQHITRFNYFNVFEKLGRIVPRFSEMFQPDFKTTTHLLTPFIASISFSTAARISSAVSPSKWKIPLGALLILKFRKK
jgi:2-polyprenyl-3-methyl-5-hydroxy-6-metoxy-1,4-benzoquinol methylase